MITLGFLGVVFVGGCYNTGVMLAWWFGGGFWLWGWSLWCVVVWGFVALWFVVGFGFCECVLLSVVVG